MSEVERIVLSRIADTRRFDFTEETLERIGIGGLTLEDLASERAVNLAARELLKHVTRFEVEHNASFPRALRHAIDQYPLLFKLSRLEKTRNKVAAVVVLEEDE